MSDPGPDEFDKPALLVDTHVHFHPSFHWGTFLESASANFAAARRKIGTGNASPGCLIFTENAGTSCFHALQQDSAIQASTGWRVTPTAEACSLLLGRDDTPDMMVIAGRQIVTVERIEVLALGMTEEVPDRRSIQETLAAVSDREAIAVLPWGFGKWWGRRGRTIHRLLAERAPGSFCLGDNGGRPRRMPRPALLKHAESRGFLVLAGSDPLRLPSHMTRAGSFGSILHGWEPTTRPMEAIRKRLETTRRSPPCFGSQSSLTRALHSQLALRFS